MPTAAPAASLAASLRGLPAVPGTVGERDALERESFARIAAGGEDGAVARREFAARNVPLVVGVARAAWCHFYAARDPNRLMDLVSIGCVSLMNAVDHFDPSRGVRFSTYATWCVRNEINRSVRWALAREARTCGEAGRGAGQDAHEPPDRSPGPAGAAAAADELARLAGWLALLRPRYRRVLELRYGLDGGEPRTLEAVGLLMGGITKERARQLERAALGKLRGIAGAGVEGDRDRDREGKGG